MHPAPQLFYMPSPYVVSGSPPPLPFSTHPYLPTPKGPRAKGQPHFHTSNSSFTALPPAAQWR